MISVCMATYNGEKYIFNQLHSILNQLDSEDEVIIVDDNSRDKTVEIINSFGDSRVKVIKQDTNKGHVKAFNKALSMAVGEFVFLSDQDDYWPKDRVNEMVALCKEENVLLVNSNYAEVHEQGNDADAKVVNVGKSTRIGNIVSILSGTVPYYGNTFCMRDSLVQMILPIPEWVEAHDLYIGLMANVKGKVRHFNKTTVLRTIHDSNMTVRYKRPFLSILRSRLIMMRIIFKALK